MADKPLKSIKFPGLADKYTVPTEAADVDAVSLDENSTVNFALGVDENGVYIRYEEE